MTSYQESQLDKLTQELALLKGKGKCEVCGKENRTVCGHHIVRRTNKSVRWYLENICLLCVEHHTMGDFSAHRSPDKFENWIKDKRVAPIKY